MTLLSKEFTSNTAVNILHIKTRAHNISDLEGSFLLTQVLFLVISITKGEDIGNVNNTTFKL